MSADYSWIKKGVKAEIFGLVVNSHKNGWIIDIDHELENCVNCAKDYEFVGYIYEEGKAYEVKNLKPFNPPNWEGIIDGSVECRDVNTVMSVMESE